jgi:hypothetical protein
MSVFWRVARVRAIAHLTKLVDGVLDGENAQHGLVGSLELLAQGLDGLRPDHRDHRIK